MAKYHFFISYSHKNADLAQRISTLLQNQGYSVFWDNGGIPGMNWAEVIAEAVSNSTYFLPVITEDFLSSRIAKMELDFAISTSKGRGQAVFPLIFTDQPLPPALHFQLATWQCFFIRQTDELETIVSKIDQAVGYDIKSAALYEKLAEYRNLKHAVKEADTLCQLINLLCQKWKLESISSRRTLCMELCRLLQQLSQHSMGYDAESKAFGYTMHHTASQATALLKTNDSGEDIFLQDLFFSAFAVQLKYWAWEVSTEGVDLGTGGDVFAGIIDPFPIQKHVDLQKPYVKAFQAAFAQVQDTLDSDQHFSAEEIAFIKHTPSCVLSPSKNCSSPFRRSTVKSIPQTEDEEILLSVAKFMQEGNKLFDVLQKRGIAGDFLKCLLTSYERLKNYCQIVGATDVAAECIDRIVEIRGQLDKQSSNPEKNEKAENGIKSLLGFTLSSSGSYDVFISFKNEDSDLAEKVYQLCQRHMKVPFWSKRTLPELSKSEYEDAIYDALRKAKHFVVVLSNLEYLKASWLQREMKTFDRAITEGRKPGGNFVIVATDAVYDEIIRSNKACLDERFCGYQILKMSEYEKELIPYIS